MKYKDQEIHKTQHGYISDVQFKQVTYNIKIEKKKCITLVESRLQSSSWQTFPGSTFSIWIEKTIKEK